METIEVEILGNGTPIVILDSNSATITGGMLSAGDYVLRPELTAASGGLQTQIDTIILSTGNLTGEFVRRAESGQFYSITNPNQYISSGNTGNFASDQDISNLQNQTNSLSGDFLNYKSLDLTGLYVSGGESIVGRVLLTGLGGLIVSQLGQIITFSGGAGGSTDLSGFATTGSLDLRYYLQTNPNQYVNSGNTGYLTGTFPTRAETGKFYQNNVNQYCNSGDLTVLSGYLSDLIVEASSDVSSINSISGAVLITGDGNITVTNDSQTIRISGNIYGLTTTGSNDLRYYSITNPNNFLHSGNTGNLIGSWQTGNLVGKWDTGNFYRIENVNNYSNSGNLYQTGANLFVNDTIISGEIISLSGDVSIIRANLTNTGITLLNQISSLSGDLIVSGRNLDNKISTLSGQIVYSNQTGGFYRDNINSYSTSGNVANTGADLLSRHQSLSGNLITTGQTLLNQITSFSGQFLNSGDRYILLSGQQISLSGDLLALQSNLVSTGITLINSDAGLQGQINNTTKISVTGSAELSGIVNFTGLGSVTTTLLNQTVYISGAAGGSSFAWSHKTSDFTGVSNNGYIFSNITGLVNMTLPTTATLGDIIRVVGRGSGNNGLWKVLQQSNHISYFGNTNTTSGVSGFLSGTHPRDSIDLLMVGTDSTEWQIITSIGNIAIN